MERGERSAAGRAGETYPFPSPFRPLLEALLRTCRRYYGPRLVALAVFGSLGRGTAGPESDVDLLLVCRDLPSGRIPRVEEFCAQVEPALGPLLAQLAAGGIHTRLSPVFKTPEELEAGSPLLLDMVEDAVILYDPGGVLAGRLQRLRERLAELGARRIWRGEQWYWDLKPDYRPGEVFEL
ncbi:MAG: nucleotidyltransferase domain-containing protein [Chloroflexia bacterium]